MTQANPVTDKGTGSGGLGEEWWEGPKKGVKGGRGCLTKKATVGQR